MCFNKASYLVSRLKEAGLFPRFPDHPFFNEVLVKLDRPVKQVMHEASEAGYLAGYNIGEHYPELSDCILIAVTEKRTKAEIDGLVDLLAGEPVTVHPTETGHDAVQFVGRDLAE